MDCGIFAHLSLTTAKSGAYLRVAVTLQAAMFRHDPRFQINLLSRMKIEANRFLVICVDLMCAAPGAAEFRMITRGKVTAWRDARLDKCRKLLKIRQLLGNVAAFWGLYGATPVVK